ncbi:MAG: hypothetical protein ABSG15_05370 [FCB group bacterium]
MKYKIIIAVIITIIIIVIFYSFSQKPDYIFTRFNPDRKVEIYILFGGATSSDYAKYKIIYPDHEVTFTKKIYQNIRKIEMNPNEDTIIIISGTYWNGWISEDTLKINIK